jgi:chromate transporter
VLEAVVRIGRRALKNNVMLGLAAAAFVAIFFLDVPFPAIVLTAGLIGLIGGRAQLPQFAVGGGHGAVHGPGLSDADSALGEAMPAHARPSLGWSLKIGAICLVLWLGPVIALLLALGPGDTFSQVAVFFSKMAVVTFGGAYAVLAYVAQAAVETYGWLRPGEMLDGLGMAETTPGPLIMVVQFVGFMAGFRNPGGLSPLFAGALAGLLTTWVTFVPCFMWIFLGAPFIEQMRANRALAGALAAITASVVGVILNLAVWFALHTLFGEVREQGWGVLQLSIPVLDTVNPAALALSAVALLAIFRFKVGMITVLAGCAAAGIALRAATGGL